VIKAVCELSVYHNFLPAVYMSIQPPPKDYK
jgi:hypothetical protein